MCSAQQCTEPRIFIVRQISHLVSRAARQTTFNSQLTQRQGKLAFVSARHRTTCRLISMANSNHSVNARRLSSVTDEVRLMIIIQPRPDLSIERHSSSSIESTACPERSEIPRCQRHVHSCLPTRLTNNQKRHFPTVSASLAGFLSLSLPECA